MLYLRTYWIYVGLLLLAVTFTSGDVLDIAGEGDEDDTDMTEDDDADIKEDRKGTRPRGLTAEVLNSTTISLTWKHPKITTEQCPVKRYVLRLKQEGARRSRAWKVDGARRGLGLHNLKSETLYSIRLVAITCHGKGKPSKWLDIRTSDSSTTATVKKDGDRKVREEPVGIETRPPGRPNYVRTRTYPDSVMLMWQPPSDTEVMVRGYMVGYGEGVPDVNWRYVDASQRNVTVKDLKPRTQYIISLRAFNNEGKGPTVYDMVHTRDLSGPTVDPQSALAPEDVRAKVLSPTNVWLQWKDPSLGRTQTITDNRYYNVHYKALPDAQTLSVVVKALHVVLYQLTPGTTYIFKVRTVKDSFYSDFSEMIQNTTYETAPGSAPRSVVVVPSNTTQGVLISWRPPKQPNGNIKGYLVLHSDDRVRPIAEWNALATADTSAFVSDLDLDVTYYFKVQARNSVGYGPLSKTAAYTLPSDWRNSMDTGVLAQNGNDYNYDYDKDDENMPSVPLPHQQPYPLDNHNQTDQDNVPQFSGNTSQNVSDILTSQNTVDNSPSKNKRHDSEATPPPMITSKSGKSEIQFAAKVLHTISAFITWPSTPPGCNCEDQAKNMEFIFHLYMRGQEETPRMLQLRSNMVHLEDLDPNERYHYQVKYIFPNGTETAWSQEQALDTDCRGANRR